MSHHSKGVLQLLSNDDGEDHGAADHSDTDG